MYLKILSEKEISKLSIVTQVDSLITSKTLYYIHFLKTKLRRNCENVIMIHIYRPTITGIQKHLLLSIVINYVPFKEREVSPFHVMQTIQVSTEMHTCQSQKNNLLPHTRQ